MIIKGIAIAILVLIALYILLPVLGIMTAPLDIMSKKVSEGLGVQEETMARDTAKQSTQALIVSIIILVLGVILVYSMHTKRR